MYKGRPILSDERCAGKTYLAILGGMEISDSLKAKVRNKVSEYVQKEVIGGSGEAVVRSTYHYLFAGGRLQFDTLALMIFQRDMSLDEFIESHCPKEGTEEYEIGKYFRWVTRPEILVEDINILNELFEEFNSISPKIKATIYTNLPSDYYSKVPAQEIPTYKAAEPVLARSSEISFPPLIDPEEDNERIEEDLKFLDEHPEFFCG